MAEFFAPPGDIEAAAITYLKPFFPGCVVTTRRPFGTDWQNPPAGTCIIRVQVVAGEEPRSLVLDPWTLAVEVWHPDSMQASIKAGEVSGRLNAWQGSGAGLLVYECRATRPRSVPDPLTAVPRYLMTAAGTARLMGV